MRILRPQLAAPAIATTEADPLAAPEASSRRFTIGDGMILVALAACVLTLFTQSIAPIRIGNYVREWPGVVSYLYSGGPRPATFRNSSMEAIRHYLWMTPVTTLVETGLPLFVLLTPAFLLFRLRKPRPSWRSLLRQPGMVGCLAAVLAVLIEIDLMWFAVEIPTPMPLNIGLAVVTAWTVLGVFRLWRSEPSWVNRLGRVLGVGWIAIGLWAAVEMAWPG